MESRKPTINDLEFFGSTMSSLRRKTLEELSLDKIEKAKFFGLQEKDDRVRLIYRAVILNKVNNSLKRKADSLGSSVWP